MSAIIKLERPDTTDAFELITELEAHLESLYPRESRHGFSVDKLIAQRVAFFVLRENDIPAGCTVIARVAEGSDASLHLNESCGFVRVGTLREVGRKFGRLLDVHVLQKILD